MLGVCFYDGFCHKNTCSKDVSIPDFGKIRPFLFLESNDLPFDNLIRRKTVEYAKAFDFPTVEVKSCY